MTTEYINTYAIYGDDPIDLAVKVVKFLKKHKDYDYNGGPYLIRREFSNGFREYYCQELIKE